MTACLRWLRRCGRARGADGYDGERVYRLRVRAQQHLGWRLKRIFGLALHEQSVYFDFGSDDERQRLLSFLTPLLPLTVTVRHKAAGGPLLPLSPLQLGGGGGGSGSGGDDGAGVGLRRRSVSSSSEGSASAAAPTTEVLSLFVGSWNMGDAPAAAALDAWLPRDAHDVYVVATQEGSDEHWPMAVESHLGSSYVKVSERRMGGIQLLLFTHRYAAPQPARQPGATARQPASPAPQPARPAPCDAAPECMHANGANRSIHAAKISHVETSFLPTGVLGVGTNKGAVALALSLREARLCVVNCHLAAHHEKLLQARNSRAILAQFGAILGAIL